MSQRDQHHRGPAPEAAVRALFQVAGKARAGYHRIKAGVLQVNTGSSKVLSDCPTRRLSSLKGISSTVLSLQEKAREVLAHAKDARMLAAEMSDERAGRACLETKRNALRANVEAMNAAITAARSAYLCAEDRQKAQRKNREKRSSIPATENASC